MTGPILTKSGRHRLFLSMAACSLLGGAPAFAQPAPVAGAAPAANPIEADGTVNVPGFRLPPSAYLSPEARAALPRKPTDPQAPLDQLVAAGLAGKMRGRIGELMAPQIRHVAERYPVTMTDTDLGGVPAVRVLPAAPIPAANRGKVLLDLPGGGFVMGAAHGTGMIESIPLASLARVEIDSITYRQAPEFKYPAGEEDMVAAYRALLKSHRPEDIGIFGCSAGGVLAAEATGWLLKANLPLPGAIGIFCASGDARFEGDSRSTSRPFHALGKPESPRTYFAGVDLTDPLVSPIFSPDLLKRFPPTLIITATRAQDLSGAVNTHRLLVKAGANADLHVWDGLDHAFFYNIDLPESQEAFSVMADFFRKHLELAK